jgi:hypothetical protein
LLLYSSLRAVLSYLVNTLKQRIDLKLIHISNYKHDCKDNIVAIFTTIIICYFVGGDTEIASWLSRPTIFANRFTNSALRAFGVLVTVPNFNRQKVY